ncbi:MAG: hypothetical protein VX892_04150 [Candidatus Thermoplasmatota archaeon]|nr:hypothetical protein [Candidatus Thermoplasmatota archaeon]
MSGLQTSWTFADGTQLTLQEVLALSEDLPIEILPIEEVMMIRTVAHLDQLRVYAADPSHPILIVEDADRRWILDGNHRLQKALNEDHPTIRAKILRGVI